MDFFDELTFDDWHSLLSNCVAWAEVRDETGRLELDRTELAICVTERPGRWRARHRRGLHVRGQLQRVLSDVFDYEPTQLWVDVPADEDDSDEPDDDVSVARVS
ncbi:MAG: hypothetical protein QOJ79_3503 [Actinomycetota bacterium]|jgi:hypothetical protein|nr:hypothetical protein [Actinomycetota bacterium]